MGLPQCSPGPALPRIGAGEEELTLLRNEPGENLTTIFMKI